MIKIKWIKELVETNKLKTTKPMNKNKLACKSMKTKTKVFSKSRVIKAPKEVRTKIQMNKFKISKEIDRRTKTTKEISIMKILTLRTTTTCSTMPELLQLFLLPNIIVSNQLVETTNKELHPMKTIKFCKQTKIWTETKIIKIRNNKENIRTKDKIIRSITEEVNNNSNQQIMEMAIIKTTTNLTVLHNLVPKTILKEWTFLTITKMAESQVNRITKIKTVKTTTIKMVKDSGRSW